METSGVPREGFKRRAPHEPRKSRDIVYFPWVNTAAGRAAKYILLRLADLQLEGATSAVLNRQFKKHGLNEEKLYSDFVQLCPEMPGHYMAVTGREMTPHVLYNRWHKTVYKNGDAGKGGHPGWSREHYTSSRKLRGVAEKCEAAFMSRRPLTMSELEKLGELS
jgi:hypothetical protein